MLRHFKYFTLVTVCPCGLNSPLSSRLLQVDHYRASLRFTNSDGKLKCAGFLSVSRLCLGLYYWQNKT